MKRPIFFNFFFLDELQGVEVLYFGGNLAGKLRGIELGNPGDAALAGEQVFPHLFRRCCPRRKSGRFQ